MTAMLSITEAAKKAGCSTRTMRRRVLALNEQRPDLGLVVRPGTRKLLINPRALQRALHRGHDDLEMAELQSQILRLDRKVQSLIRGYRHLKSLVITPGAVAENGTKSDTENT